MSSNARIEGTAPRRNGTRSSWRTTLVTITATLCMLVNGFILAPAATADSTDPTPTVAESTIQTDAAPPTDPSAVPPAADAPPLAPSPTEDLTPPPADVPSTVPADESAPVDTPSDSASDALPPLLDGDPLVTDEPTVDPTDSPTATPTPTAPVDLAKVDVSTDKPVYAAGDTVVLTSSDWTGRRGRDHRGDEHRHRRRHS